MVSFVKHFVEHTLELVRLQMDTIMPLAFLEILPKVPFENFQDDEVKKILKLRCQVLLEKNEISNDEKYDLIDLLASIESKYFVLEKVVEERKL